MSRTEALRRRHVDAGLVVERYADLALGIADASKVILAMRCAASTIVTLDRRHVGTIHGRDRR